MKDQLIAKILDVDPSLLRGYNAGLLQGKAYSRLHSLLSRALFPFDVSIPEWKLLGQLYDNGSIKLSVLADLLSYDPPMVTKLVKQLEKKKMLKRQQDANDERAKIITITTSGKKLIESAEPDVRKTMREMLRGVSREEIKAYLKVLTIIVKNTQS